MLVQYYVFYVCSRIYLLDLCSYTLTSYTITNLPEMMKYNDVFSEQITDEMTCDPIKVEWKSGDKKGNLKKFN